MTYNYQILLGRITRIHGIEGTVIIRLEKDFIENVPEMESVFIETEGVPVPFFVLELEYTGGDILKLKFKGYESIEKVSEFNGCRIFLTTTSHAVEKKTESIKGFSVILKDGRTLGKITAIKQNPGQDLLIIQTPGNGEILVPLHEDFIIKTDKRSGTIIMDLPEGLTDLNS